MLEINCKEANQNEDPFTLCEEYIQKQKLLKSEVSSKPLKDVNVNDNTASSLNWEEAKEDSVEVKGIINLNYLVNSEWLEGEHPENTDIK